MSVHVITDFFNGNITDIVCINCILSMSLGNQIVLKTQRACDNARIVGTMYLSEKQKLDVLTENAYMRRHIKQRLEICQKQYRRQGRYVDEIKEVGDFSVH